MKIYFCSITGIYNPEYDKWYSPMDNTKITNFNNKVKNLINSKGRSNLSFLDIANKNVRIGTETKTVNNWVINSNTHASDGLHYSSTLYKAIWDQAMTSVGSGSIVNSYTYNPDNYSGDGASMGSSVRMEGSEGETRENINFEDVLSNKDYYANVGDLDATNKDKVEKTAGKVVGVLTNIGIVLSIIVPIILGIKYMIFNDINSKREMIPYFVGAIFLFGICTFTKIIFSIGEKINL